jgi:hypothetical protein
MFGLWEYGSALVIRTAIHQLPAYAVMGVYASQTVLANSEPPSDYGPQESRQSIRRSTAHESSQISGLSH